MAVQTTIVLNTPVVCAIRLGITRPKTLAALRIASCKEVSRSGTRSFGSVSGAHPGVEWEGGGSTHRVEGEVGIEVVRDGIELQEKDGEEQA